MHICTGIEWMGVQFGGKNVRQLENHEVKQSAIRTVASENFFPSCIHPCNYSIPFTHDKRLALTTPSLLSNSYKNNHFFYCLRFSSAHCYLTALKKRGEMSMHWRKN